jgi:hypothetical protein
VSNRESYVLRCDGALTRHRKSGQSGGKALTRVARAAALMPWLAIPKILRESSFFETMSSVIRKTELWKSRGTIDRIAVDEWGYPSGMVWCPMKMSGMALMKCAELQKQFGCGSLAQFRIITTTKPGNVPFCWPWLRRGRECPERANEKEVRELRLELSPLKSVEKSRKNPRAYRCTACGGRKAFGARHCRHCWRHSCKRR